MRSRVTFLIVLLSCAALICWVDASAAGQEPSSETSLAASTITLNAVADATVRSWQPSSNFGSEGRLELSYAEIDVATEAVILLRFDLAALPASAIVDSATLKVYQEGATGPDPLTVSAYFVTSAWNEPTVTWNTFHIGSGMVESGCKRFRARLAGPGMRWSRPGAERLIPVRAAILSDRFDEVWSAANNSPPTCTARGTDTVLDEVLCRM